MPDGRKPRPQGETVYIDENDRLEIKRRMAAKAPPMTGADLARFCGVTPSAITLLLKNPIAKGKTRGCKFMPKLQKAIGVAITPKQPVILDKNASRRAERVLHALSGDELEVWLKNGELLVTKR